MKDISADLHIIRLAKRTDTGSRIVYGPVGVLDAVGAGFFLYHASLDISKIGIALYESDDGVKWQIPAQKEAVIMRPAGNGGHSRTIAYAGTRPFIQIEVPFEIDCYVNIDSQFVPQASLYSVNMNESGEGGGSGELPPISGGADFTELEKKIAQVEATAEFAKTTASAASNDAVSAKTTAAAAKKTADDASALINAVDAKATANAGAIETLQSSLEDTETTLAAVQKTASEGKAAAALADAKGEEAKSTALTASRNAGAAQATAGEAKTLASTAKETADTAKSTADTAKTTADEAKTAADNAQAGVEEAKTAASEAQASATTAQQNATNAATSAGAAQTAAANAQKTAEDAAKDAADSKSALAEAKVKIAEIQQTADSAMTTASAASSTADTAKTVADGLAASIEQANATATAANETSAAAMTAANTAKENAESAMTAANTAVTEASDVLNIAQAAQTAATEASNAVMEVSSDVSALTETVATVSAQADKGVADAAAAQSTANTAKAKADTSVQLSGEQTIAGVKTFEASPVIPTPAVNDNSTNAATTAFVKTAIATEDGKVVHLEGDESISGVKTFAASPLVPLAAENDNSKNAASTAFVKRAADAIKAIANAASAAAAQAVADAAGAAGVAADALAAFDICVTLNGDQNITGKKTFSFSPILPELDAADNSQNAANTAFVNSAIAAESAKAVHLTGNENVEGVKTFAVSPLVPQTDADDNSTKAANTAFVQTVASAAAARAVANLIDSSPETLDTLKELAAALGNDPNFATTIANQIGLKANTTDLTAHTGNKSNPHAVTKAQVGLGNIPNAISDEVNSTSSAQLATSKAVKTAYDLANTANTAADGKLPLTGGEMSAGFSIAGHVNSHTLISFTDLISEESDKKEIVGILRSVYSPGADQAMQSIEARNYRENGTQVNSVIAASAFTDGTAYATGPTPSTSAPANAILNREAGDRDYVKKSGDTLTGTIKVKSNLDISANVSTWVFGSVINSVDKNLKGIGWIDVVRTPEGSVTRLCTSNRSNAHSIVSVFSYDNGTKFAQCSHPRESTYSNDIDTLQASINRHPLLIKSAANFYVGGANASDTANLFAGRGTSPEMPFATLQAAVNFVEHYYTGTVKLILQDDITLASGSRIWFNYPTHIYDFTATDRAITLSGSNLTNWLALINVNISVRVNISNMTLSVVNNNNSSSFVIQSTFSYIKITNCTINCKNLRNVLHLAAFSYIYANSIEINGNCFGSIADLSDQSELNVSALTGNITGKRYSLVSGSGITTNGLGENAIPGTAAGIKDATSWVI